MTKPKEEALKDIEIVNNPTCPRLKKDEEIDKLILCDIIESTIKRIKVEKKDKDDEVDLMLKKIRYLRDIGK